MAQFPFLLFPPGYDFRIVSSAFPFFIFLDVLFVDKRAKLNCGIRRKRLHFQFFCVWLYFPGGKKFIKKRETLIRRREKKSPFPRNEKNRKTFLSHSQSSVVPERFVSFQRNSQRSSLNYEREKICSPSTDFLKRFHSRHSAISLIFHYGFNAYWKMNF